MDYKNLNNEEYWIKRAEEKARMIWKSEAEVEKILKNEYIQALEEIKKEYISILEKHGKDMEIEYKNLKKQDKTLDSKLFESHLKTLEGQQSIRNSEEALLELKKMQTLASSRNLSILESKINKIYSILLELGATEEELIGDNLKDAYKESYYQSLFQVSMATGIYSSFSVLNQRAILEAINYEWTGDMFSSHIWSNKRKLLKNLKKTIVQGIIRGKSYQGMAKDLEKAMNNSFKDCLRVIRTETAYVVEEASAKGYEESGIVDQYVIIATLDKRTSLICQKQDQQVYLLKDRQVGVNYPPFHPNCRTTVAPYFREQIINERMARDNAGKNYKTKGNPTYQEWKQKYLK